MLKQRLGDQLGQIELAGEVIYLLAQFAQELSASTDEGEVSIKIEGGILDTLWQAVMLLSDYTTYLSDELNKTLLGQWS